MNIKVKAGIVMLAIVGMILPTALVSGVLYCITYTGNTQTMSYGGYTGYFMRYTDFTFYPNDESITLSGTVDVSGLQSNGAVFVGLTDKKAVDDDITYYGWMGGAYAYFGRRYDNLVIGPTDGNLGGEIVQTFVTITDYFLGTMDPIDFNLVIYDGSVTVTIDSTDIVDDYGLVKTLNNIDAYSWGEFEYGAYIGVDSWPSTNDVDYEINVCIEVLEADIDIKPGDSPNDINLGSKGVVPVALLTTEDFDATYVDFPTVEFTGASPLRWAFEDVDLDGDVDVVFHYKTQELNLDSGSTSADLTGYTLDSEFFMGTDSVNIVP